MISLNAQILQDLSDLSPQGDKFVCSLLENFLESGPGLIQKIREESLRSNFELVKKEAHYLKSSAGNLGAMRLSRLCSQIQNLPEEEIALSLRALIEKLEGEWNIVEKEMRLEILRLSSR